MRFYTLNKRPPAPRPQQPAPVKSPQPLSSGIVETLLRLIRDQFYFAASSDRLYYQERHLLIKAITEPALYLAQRGMTCEIPAPRYQQIIMDVIATIKGHGTMAGARSPARYFWKVMQSHLQHHGDEYYEEAKRTRDSIENIALGVIKNRKTAPARDSTIEDMAALRRLVKSPGGRRPANPAHPACKPAAPPQLDLFQ